MGREQIVRVRREMLRRGVQLRIGGFELLAKVGEGGMGAVYKARQLSLDRIVALKVLRREVSLDRMYVQRFKREARLAAQIRHPNAVQVYSAGEVGGVHYMVMEYVVGATVSGLLGSGPLGERQALILVRGVASALVAAHSLGIVHRDIKPSNIMTTEDSVAKLMDLGIARQYGVGGDTITRSGSVVGTVPYMSPEQCEGRTDLDARSDIYSLGATLYHMVCGQCPFNGDTSVAIMRQHVEAPLPNPHVLNPSLCGGAVDLIRSMMEKDRDRRPQDGNEVVGLVDVVVGAG